MLINKGKEDSRFMNILSSFFRKPQTQFAIAKYLGIMLAAISLH